MFGEMDGLILKTKGARMTWISRSGGRVSKGYLQICGEKADSRMLRVLKATTICRPHCVREVSSQRASPLPISDT